MVSISKTQAQSIYGTTPSGGAANLGVLFKITPTPSVQTVVSFGIPSQAPWKSQINNNQSIINSSLAERPSGRLLIANDGFIYGTSLWGGYYGSGCIYVYNPIMDTLGILYSLDYSDGSEPAGGLIQLPNGIMYGTAQMGGLNYAGTIFSYNPATGLFSLLDHFDGTTYGSNPLAPLTIYGSNEIYGTTTYGGANSKGVLFRYSINMAKLTFGLNLSTATGYGVYGALYKANNGNLYGLAKEGGSNGFGTLFEFNPSSQTLTVKYNFDSINGCYPKGGLMYHNGKLYGVTTEGGASNIGTLFEFDLTTGTLQKIIDFGAYTGSFPQGTLSLGNDNWIYGFSKKGGAFNFGTLFKFNPLTGTIIKLSDFNNSNGANPEASSFAELSALKFSASDSVLTTPPFNIQFTNQTSNPANYIWQWQFGDGSISYQKNPSHTYTNNGAYNVTLIALDTINQKQDTLVKSNYINLSGAGVCPVTANITPTGMIMVCPGDSVKLTTTNQASGNNYQWLRTGLLLSGATNSEYWAKQTGYYQVKVDDGNCWNFSNVAFVNVYPIMIPQIIHNGLITPCTNDSLKIQVTGTFNNLLWNTGETGNSIWVKNSGLYSVSTMDNNGCSVTSAIDTINTALIPAPNICIVGVDSLSGHNMIVWNQSSNTKLDSIRVYKETSVNNVFQKIGQKGRNEIGMLVDPNSDPRVTSYRYRLMAVDSCGTETPIGNYHRTIHLQVNIGLGNAWNLHWNPYEGTQLGSYYVYRGTDSTQMSMIAVLPANINSYTDYAAPTGNVYYMLKVNLSNACTPGGSTSFSLSSSNFYNTANATIGVENIKLHDLSLSVFPNPNKGLFTIKINSATQKQISVLVFNNLGSLVSSNQFEVYGTISKKIDLSHLSKGVYFLRIQTNEDVIMRKVILQ